MSRTALRHLRLLGPLAVAATLGLGALPALAQTTPTSGECSGMRFQLANPDPGAMLQPGAIVLEGIAQDDRATDGPGIERIEFFLDSREEGGINLGTAVPGMTPGPFGPDSFQTTISIPAMVGGHDLFAYAQSTVNGAESVISLPIAIGEPPNKAFATPPPDTITESCMAGSAGTVTSTTTTTPSTATTTTTTTTTTPVQPSTMTTTTTPGAMTITFEVGNPSPGDTIHVGAFNIEGIGFDKAATEGTGIDRIEVFVDNRDEGGTIVGEGSFGSPNMPDTWMATLNLPSNMLGLHSLFFYAHSSATGEEMVVSVPVTIAP
jgi:hypothetical protein